MLRPIIYTLTGLSLALPAAGAFVPLNQDLSSFNNRRTQSCSETEKDSLGRCPLPVRAPAGTSGSSFSSGSASGGGK